VTPDASKTGVDASRTPGRSALEIATTRMPTKRYRAVRKRDRKGADVWGVAAFEPRPGKPWRQVAWKTVGRGEKAELEARALAIEMERQEAEHGERFLSWHVAGERLPLDRTVRDYVHHHSKAIGGSTARRYGQFGERLIARLGRLDLRDLREEDIAAFVTAEFSDRRAKDPTINACVLLRSVMRASLAARDAYRRAHLAEDPLPRIAKIARRTVRKLWPPALDDEARASAWTPHEVATILATAKSTARDVYGVCLFQYSTGCRIGEALAVRWSAVDLERGRVTIRLRIHAGEIGPVKTANSLRTIPIPQQLIDYLRERPQRSEWVFGSPSNRKRHWRDEDYQEAWRKLRKGLDIRQLGTHAWRHTFVSMALASGWTPGSIAEHVGCSVEMILRRYAHALKRTDAQSFSFLAPVAPPAAPARASATPRRRAAVRARLRPGRAAPAR
jgi:integrase